ncbi:MAG: hypothetical protein ACYDCC_02925 [Actinomycetota bacterium]
MPPEVAAAKLLPDTSFVGASTEAAGRVRASFGAHRPTPPPQAWSQPLKRRRATYAQQM